MPGMNTGLNADDPTVVAAFKLALLHQGIAAVLLFAVLALAWVSVREFLPAGRGSADRAALSGPEAPARRLLRISFGVLWIIDGLLQAQPGMAVGLPSQVIQPTAASSPTWVQHLVNWAGTSWSYHPIQAAAGAVWIQLGIGIWLVLARRGTMSRLAGLTAAGWGLVVWVFGESFGGIFAPGLSWLTGAPGAAACYVVAGLLVAMPERRWQSLRTGRLMLNCFGAFLVAMALLQAWPGRGFWQGDSHGQPGALTAMVQSMAAQSQPTGIADLLSGFASLVRAHGFAVNLLAVVVLAALGVGLGSARPPLAKVALIGLAVLGLADWVLVQDLGILGGLGTDPNSMIPMFLLAAASYQALTVPVVSAAAAESPAEVTAADAAGEPAAADSATADAAPAGSAAAAPSPPQTRRRALRPARLLAAFASARLATVAAAGAVGVVLLGAIPMAAAQASSSAAPILAQALDGSSAPLNSPAPGFTLTDQSGRTVSLASLRGKAVLLTFLDPVCVSDCPLIAQEFREAGQLLASQRGHVELVAVNLNPLYRGVSYLQAFDQAEHLAGIPDWLYLTGSVAQLRPVWKNFGVVSETLPAGAMLGHSDAAFVIGPDGRMLEELDFDPGPGTQATVASFATELANAAQSALGQS